MKLAALLLLLAVPCVFTSPFEGEILSVSCDGVVHSSFDIDAQIRGLPNLYTLFENSLFRQVSAACPSLKKGEFERLFSFPEMLISFVNGHEVNSPQCPTLAPLIQRIQYSFGFYGTMKIMNMPGSCTMETYAQTGRCSLAIDFPDGMTSASLEMAKCPNSRFPQIALSLHGALAENLFKPCDSNLDCAASGLSCQDLTRNLDVSFFTKWMSTLQYGSCGSFSTFVSNIRNEFWSTFFPSSSSPLSPTGVSVCAPNNILTSGWASLVPILPPATSSGRQVYLPTLREGPKIGHSKRIITAPKFPSCQGETFLDCNGNFGINFGEKLAAAIRAPFIPKLEKTVFSFLKESVKTCVGQIFSDENFLINYSPWAIDGFLARLTTDASGSKFPIIRDESPIGFLLGNYPSVKLLLPENATYSDFSQNSKATWKFSALSSLLQTTKFDVFLTAAKCPDTNQTSFVLNIDGPMRNFLSNLTVCDSDFDCGDGLICSNSENLNSEILVFDIWSIFNYRSFAPDSGMILFANYLKGTDGVNYGVWYCLPKLKTISNGYSGWGNSVASVKNSILTLSSLVSAQYSCPVSRGVFCYMDYIPNRYQILSALLILCILSLALMACCSCCIFIAIIRKNRNYQTLNDEIPTNSLQL